MRLRKAQLFISRTRHLFPIDRRDTAIIDKFQHHAEHLLSSHLVSGIHGHGKGSVLLFTLKIALIGVILQEPFSLCIAHDFGIGEETLESNHGIFACLEELHGVVVRSTFWGKTAAFALLEVGIPASKLEHEDIWCAFSDSGVADSISEILNPCSLFVVQSGHSTTILWELLCRKNIPRHAASAQSGLHGTAKRESVHAQNWRTCSKQSGCRQTHFDSSRRRKETRPENTDSEKGKNGTAV